MLTFLNSYKLQATSLNPKAGGSNGGIHLNIDGSGFGDNLDDVEIKFVKSSSRKKRSLSGGSVGEVTGVTTNEIQVTAPPLEVGTYDVHVS